MRIAFILPLALCFAVALSAQTSPQQPVVYETTAVDKVAEYPGGIAELSSFLSQNVQYPEACRKNKTQGTVLVSFVVDQNGVPGSFKHVGDPEMDNRLIDEGLRVARLMTKWTPAQKGGKAVACQMVLPVKFALH